MLKNKKSQTSSITIIVAAVIGLIILVVIIAMLGGKLGNFGKGTEDANTCDRLCTAAGYSEHDASAPDTIGIKDDDSIQCKCK